MAQPGLMQVNDAAAESAIVFVYRFDTAAEYQAAASGGDEVAK